MKFPILSTAIVTLCALTATAQAEIKISSVNIQELYTKFYKRFETENTLQKQLTEIKADVKVREDKLRALQKEIEQIKGKYDSSLSDSAVAKLRKQFDEKVNELKAAGQLKGEVPMMGSWRKCTPPSTLLLTRAAATSCWIPALSLPRLLSA